MLRHFLIVAIVTVAALSPVVGSETDGRVRVALLPMEQDRVSNSSSASYDGLSAALPIEFTKTTEFELIKSSQVREEFESRLISEAVFELLVTDNLSNTLRAMDLFGTSEGRRRLYGEAARRLGIDYLVEVVFEERRDRTEVNYGLADTQANRVVLAKSFVDAPGAPRRVARETAKRVNRDLWRLKHHR